MYVCVYVYWQGEMIEPNTLCWWSRCSTTLAMALAFCFWDRILLSYFCPAWPWISNLPASTSQVSGIESIYHHAQQQLFIDICVCFFLTKFYVVLEFFVTLVLSGPRSEFKVCVQFPDHYVIMREHFIYYRVSVHFGLIRNKMINPHGGLRVPQMFSLMYNNNVFLNSQGKSPSLFLSWNSNVCYYQLFLTHRGKVGPECTVHWKSPNVLNYDHVALMYYFTTIQFPTSIIGPQPRSHSKHEDIIVGKMQKIYILY
jgi:hypothetical protein